MHLLNVIAEHLNRRLQPGDVGIIGARAGVGKTACLAQIALSDLVAGHTVLHVALDATVGHVREWYDRLLDEARRASPEDALTGERYELERRRHIHSYPSRGFDAPRLGLALHFLAEVMEFRPRTVVVDGLLATDLDPTEVHRLRELAQSAGFALWLSLKTNGEGSTPLDLLSEAATVLVQLEPGKAGMTLRVDLDRRTGRSGELPLVLDPATLLLRNV